MINSIATGTPIKYSKKAQNNSNVDNEVKALQSQKSQIEKEIEKIKGNTTTTQKIKDDLIKPLQKQIDEIESEIQQKQMENIQDNNDNNTNKTSSSADNNNLKNKNDLTNDNLLLNNLDAYNSIKNMSHLKTLLKGSSSVLSTEAEIDEGRGNKIAAAKKRTQATKNDININSINSKIYKQSAKINKNISKTNNVKNQDTISAENNDKIINSKKIFRDDSICKITSNESKEVSLDTFA